MAGKSDNGENGSASTASKAAAGGGFSSLTTREQEILAKAMTCLKTAPEVSICIRIQTPRSQSFRTHALASVLFSCPTIPLPPMMHI